MDPRFSIKAYPRRDTVYRIKNSYNFEAIKSRVYITRTMAPREELTKWAIHAIIGAFVGTVAFLMGTSEEHIADYHAEEA